MSQPANVKCPACGRRGDWLATKYSPFCSHRCKLVDLGRWFSGENKISEPLKPEHFAEFEELPPGKNPDAPETES